MRVRAVPVVRKPWMTAEAQCYFLLEEWLMCLFTKGRNAVIAVLDLALHERTGPVALPAICQRTGMSLSYLESIFRRLRSYGIVLTVRGSHGGFLLARAVEELTVADILRAVDESLVAPAGNVNRIRRRPGLRRNAADTANELWVGLNNQLLDYLGMISLKDLAEQHRINRQ